MQMENRCLRRWIQRTILAFLLLALGCGFAPVSANAAVPKLPRFPSINPDGSEIVFSVGGDLWIVPVHGGVANRLTRHRFDDLHSSWSPDGQSLVFTSMRDGYMNLWRIQRDGTGTAQLTHSDRFLRAPHWSIDEQGMEIVTFSALLEADVYRDQRPYRISPQGGEHELLHQAFGSEPRLSPDGQRVVFTRGGYYHDWNHRRYRGPDAMNVWVLHRSEERFEAVTEWEGDDGSARWVDNNTLLFMSERQLDTVNLYRVNLDGDNRALQRITHFRGRGIQDFDVSRDGSMAVLQVWDRLYTLNLVDPRAEPKPLHIQTGDDGWDDHTLRWIDRDVTEAVLSPDGQVMAYIAYGRVYIRHVDEYSPTRAVIPDSHARHQDIAWSQDGLHLYFVSDADGTLSIYKAQVALTRDEIRLAHQQLPMESGALLAKSTATHVSRGPESAQHNYEHSVNSNVDDPLAPLHPNNPLDPLDSLDPSEPEPAGEPTDVPSSSQDKSQATEKSGPMAEQEDPARWHDAVQFRVVSVVVEDGNDRGVSPSPDGRSVAFRRGRGDLVVMDLLTKELRTLVKGWDSALHWRWSPDGRHLAYDQNDLNFSTIYLLLPRMVHTNP
ncbi:PD40 domain-containing protein [Desulfonatronum sp. SC1]|uniref:PD40 domain-containing protein n=1 Tax=Desulfonatronum sp. SC1 TaxID=2109626 RepID=UPI0018EE54D2|nr:PD40 domain-containing protein [Desulfonatronum sp. SC1]